MKSVFVALVALLLVQLAATLIEECKLTARSEFDGAAARTNIRIPQNCTSGRIAWLHPQGQLRIQLTRSCQQPYSLCLAGSSSTSVAEVREVTGGANKLLNLPTAGKPACTLAINGAVELLVVAESDVAFLASFNYTVVTRPQSG